MKKIVMISLCISAFVYAGNVPPAQNALYQTFETIEQLNYLQQEGCDEIQGYFYSKPLLAAEFEALRNKKTIHCEVLIAKQ